MKERLVCTHIRKMGIYRTALFYCFWTTLFLWKRDLWPYLHFKYSWSRIVKINELIVRETAWVTNFLGRKKEIQRRKVVRSSQFRSNGTKRSQFYYWSHFSKILVIWEDKKKNADPKYMVKYFLTVKLCDTGVWPNMYFGAWATFPFIWGTIWEAMKSNRNGLCLELENHPSRNTDLNHSRPEGRLLFGMIIHRNTYYVRGNPTSYRRVYTSSLSLTK